MAAADPRAQLEVHPHHEQRKVCPSRAKYREGRKPRAVKIINSAQVIVEQVQKPETVLSHDVKKSGWQVYTINLESRYLLVQGVPAIGVMQELIEQFALYGAVEEYNALDEYPAEEFTEVYLIKFQRLQSARVAKRKLDERSFFGGLLHICYAPEFESVQETREKLQDRRRYVARATSDKDWQVKEKKQEAPDNSSPASGFMDSGFRHPSSRAPTVQPRDPLLCFMPPPSIPPDCQEYSSTSSPSASCSRYLPDHAHHTPPPSNVERTSKPAQSIMGGGTARFMPRTTQLQERQRRREQSSAMALSPPDSKEIVIGPKLPQIPKLDLDDDSLNTTADVIRGKLKKVSGAYTVNTADAPGVDTQSAPPVKQRRRI